MVAGPNSPVSFIIGSGFEPGTLHSAFLITALCWFFYAWFSSRVSYSCKLSILKKLPKLVFIWVRWPHFLITWEWDPTVTVWKKLVTFNVHSLLWPLYIFKQLKLGITAATAAKVIAIHKVWWSRFSGQVHIIKKLPFKIAVWKQCISGYLLHPLLLIWDSRVQILYPQLELIVWDSIT